MGKACKDCKRQYCEHDKIKYRCSDCGGAEMCVHKIRKYACKECVSVDTIQTTKRQCRLCCSKQLGWKRIRAGILQCAECDKTVPERTEKIVVRKLLSILYEQIPSAKDDVLLGGSSCGTEKHRPDVAWVLPDRVIILEIDEDGGHPEQNASCEIARMSRITESIHKEGVKAVLFLRLNPDAQDLYRVSLDDRIAKIAADFKECTIRNDLDATKMQVNYYFYHSKCFDKIAAARDSDSFIVNVIETATFVKAGEKRMRVESDA